MSLAKTTRAGPLWLETDTEQCRKLGISEQTFYSWKKKYAGMGIVEMRRVKQLEDENRRLKGLVADLTLDKHMLQEVLRKSSEARCAPGARPPDDGHVQRQRAAGLPGHPARSVDVLLEEPCQGPDAAADAPP
jgi:putative transposase